MNGFSSTMLESRKRQAENELMSENCKHSVPITLAGILTSSCVQQWLQNNAESWATAPNNSLPTNMLPFSHVVTGSNTANTQPQQTLPVQFFLMDSGGINLHGLGKHNLLQSQTLSMASQQASSRPPHFPAVVQSSNSAFSAGNRMYSMLDSPAKSMLLHAGNRQGEFQQSSCFTNSVTNQSSPPSESQHNKYCHFCQHVKIKRADSMFACQNKHCSRRFCTHCLRVHLASMVAEDVDALSPSDKGWSCPVCRKTCCCSILECKREHRHCKAYRYRRRRAEQVKRPASDDRGNGPCTDSVADLPAGPKRSPKLFQPKAGSIESLLDSDEDNKRVWLTPAFFRAPAEAPTPSVRSAESDTSSPSPSGD